MLSQIIPSTTPREVRVSSLQGFDASPQKEAQASDTGDGGLTRSVEGLTNRSRRAAAHESLRVQFHQQVGLEGSGLNPGAVPSRSGAGWVRGALRASGLGRSGVGCRRQRASERDRRVLVDAVALFGRAGSTLDSLV